MIFPVCTLFVLLTYCHCRPTDTPSDEIVVTSEAYQGSEDDVIVAINRVEDTLKTINDEVKNCIEDSETKLSYATELISDDEPREQKFSSVLNDIDELEVHVKDAIGNLTANRQYAFGAMLKPMVTQIHDLRLNLTLLRHQVIGIVALENLRTHVNSLQSDVNSAMDAVEVAEVPKMFSADQVDTELFDIGDSLSWVTD
ncbi:hypothetical protein HDE_03341 [Halotydeus destructor]|nr:hypothetical protein HDE_03341 [Halotydeus destructor]